MLLKFLVNGVEIVLIQGGMGIWVSLAELAAAVSRSGGLGVVSSASLDLLWSIRTDQRVNTYQATKLEIEKAKKLADNGPIGINIMTAIVRHYVESVEGAIAGGVDVIISGAGMPYKLPEFVGNSKVLLVPIVSSVRAVKIICKKWMWNYNRLPDAIIIEGRKAGGHNGLKIHEIGDENFRLEILFRDIVKYMIKNELSFPVIVAGGIYTPDKVAQWVIGKNADYVNDGVDESAAVQVGTILVASDQSGASMEFKNALIAANPENVIMSDPSKEPPGSSCEYPFAVLDSSPGLYEREQPICRWGYVRQPNRDGGFHKCLAVTEWRNHFCICGGLLAATAEFGTHGKYERMPEKALFTSGKGVDNVVAIEPAEVICKRLVSKI